MTRIILLFLLALVAWSCSQGQKSGDTSVHDHQQSRAAAQQYTCPMHPDVVRDEPGTCPVCGMSLVLKNNVSAAAAHDLMLNDTQIRLANITTQKVTTQPIGQTVVVNARLTVNQNLSEVIGSRAAGRIEKLFIKETGITIQKGQPLYQLYSENLLTLQQEFLLAKEQYEALGSTEQRYKSFYEAARRKLILYGLTDNQVQKLAQDKTVQNTIVFLSPVSGVVADVSVTEGQYVSEGSILMRIENINKLWLETELYPHETMLAKIGDKTTARISGYENENIEAVIDFLSPEYRSNSQIVVMRASIDNPDHRYKPGMQAHVFFSHSAKKAVAIPVDAVIRDGRGAHVYVQRGRNTFRAQAVKTGIEDFDKVEVTDGLHDGDTVAITGAYLLYSEMVLKNGTEPMAGHNAEQHH